MIRRLTFALMLFTLAAGLHASAVFDMVDGRRLPFNSLKGKWVVLNYWASWCHVCVEEIPVLNAFYDKYREKNVLLFGVNYDALPVKEQKELLHNLHIRYPAIVEDPAYALGLGDIRGVPATFVFNPKGELTQTLYGPQTEKSLLDVISLQ